MMRKGGVLDMDLWPVKYALVATWILDGVLLLGEFNFVITLLVPEFDSQNLGEVLPCNVLMIFSWICGIFISSNKEMLSFVLFRSSSNSYSNPAKGVGEIFHFVAWSIILGLEGVVLEELGVVLVEEEGCLGVEVVGEVGLVVLGTSSKTFLPTLLVVTTFFEMCTSSVSSSSSP